ncbi:patatin-like phospholipase family protein [Stigmatella erecta]|uniref:Patatin-like phospholipase n=1 Tax=Stigmatella erecta TaxID=83460 RepID=A0A1I0IS19_9BACT|nr:patatin-like phospholipase family protein [Stigmatella erecta]SET99226.1 Patatin-like phospholipase [Stigmatella erecta]
MPPSLTLRAGPEALRRLREHGLRAEDVDVLPGASGGPKWLVLSGLDRVLFGEFLRQPRTRPLHLIGASIGSWRLACLAQKEPMAALDRFAAAYLEQRYPPRPPPSLVSETSGRILDALLGPQGAEEIVGHPWARLHVMTTLCRGPTASDTPGVLFSGLAVAALANGVSRRTLALQMKRALFHTAGDSSPFAGLKDLPTVHQPLTRENLRAALLASASIPGLMSGVRVPGALAGTYRDGGIVDYHPNLHFGPGQGLVLYPHFYPHVIPGWFDKSLRWRWSLSRHFQRALLLSPSEAFVSRLPHGKIPDREDFFRFGDAERIRNWNTVRQASAQLGEEFQELLATGRWVDRVQPL